MAHHRRQISRYVKPKNRGIRRNGFPEEVLSVGEEPPRESRGGSTDLGTFTDTVTALYKLHHTGADTSALYR